MATKLNTVGKVDRQDTFRIDPSDIVPGVNSRIVDSPDQAKEIKSLAVSIYEHGQKVPALAHKSAEGKVILDGGFKRLEAIKLLREGFEAKDDLGFVTTIQQPDAKLWVNVDTGVKTDKEAFIASLLENIRTGVTDRQEAEANAVLRNTYGYTDTEIAHLYGRSNTNRVAELTKFLEAPADVKAALEKGVIKSVSAANELSALPKEDRKEIIDAAKGVITAPAIREKVSEKKEATGDTSEGPVAPKPRNVAAFDKFVDELKVVEEGDEPTDARILTLCGALQSWFRAKSGNKALTNALTKAVGA